ncbi:MAG: endonuclease III [Myxococcales bacterium]|nr:endonuclease III [Myxococcales bacterium]
MSSSSRPRSPKGGGPSAAALTRLFERLDTLYPSAGTALHHTSPYELLVAVVLSAQCTDARVNLVTPALFERYPTVTAMARADQGDVEALIHSCGFFRNKAKHLIALSQEIVRDCAGAVPIDRERLTRLPGVGVKTAGVVSMQIGGAPAFPVDTHVQRLAFRLGLSARRVPEQIERDLMALMPAERWVRAHHLLIWHGRGPCDARKPECDTCDVRDLCPKNGVGQATKAKAKDRTKAAFCWLQ